MKQSELRKIIREELDKTLNQKYQVIFYDVNHEETPVKQLFNSKEEAEKWADDYEYDYQDIAINDRGDDEWKTFYKFHNPEDKETYSGYEVKPVENISESKKINSIEEFNSELDKTQELLNSYINQYHKK